MKANAIFQVERLDACNGRLAPKRPTRALFSSIRGKGTLSATRFVRQSPAIGFVLGARIASNRIIAVFFFRPYVLVFPAIPKVALIPLIVL